MDSEVKRGLKSNSVRSGQTTYEACDDGTRAPIKFTLFGNCSSYAVSSCLICSVSYVGLPLYIDKQRALF